ncbi:holo-[acyl-carrier protein] synthase [Oikeobacillus pervagus]|uniref:Holo-[acyl-carrier-protein] synthase n=1 Tax=Oikeobacillus pervagus TaxID=1325931 RepID=A0AAJ1WLU0_9BACI|nr:holo-ACP synthase [Oikeobacillus pervagus]MDQ0216586.1 holo-[acyl-carrier protein] synthase [Oikeobacillus pervagus]
MIKGIGLDIVEIARVQKIAERQPKFIQRILTQNEQSYYLQLSNRRKIEYLAGRFSLKEAFAKAYGTGIGEELSFTDIETDYNDKGKPIIKKPFGKGVHLSVTHSQDYVATQVIIEE